MSDDNRSSAAPRPPRSGKTGRGREETHAFIVRIRLSIAADGTRSHPRFSLEDVATGRTDHFASFPLVAERLSSRVHGIVSGPVDGAQH